MCKSRKECEGENSNAQHVDRGRSSLDFVNGQHGQLSTDTRGKEERGEDDCFAKSGGQRKGKVFIP